MRHVAAILSLVLFAGGLSGCGTIKRNEVKEGYQMLPQSVTYPATALDFGLMAQAGFIGLVMLPDVPVSLVTDTLLLPYDLATRKRVPEGQQGKEREAQAVARTQQRKYELEGQRTEAARWLAEAQLVIIRTAGTNSVRMGGQLAEAHKWLASRRTDRQPPAFGWQDKRRFVSYAEAMGFVDSLYAAGAKRVYVRLGHGEDTMLVVLPSTARESILEILANEASVHGMEQTMADNGGLRYLWWGMSRRRFEP